MGARVYGYLPMSTHVMVWPGAVSANGFTDTAPHRAERAPIYNRYSFTATDPLYSPEGEAMISLFRPLFTTSFLLEDLHRSNDYFGARNVILSSASSKTSIGLAHLLSRASPDTVRVTGLTSPSNRAFVEGLGCYDAVVEYGDVISLPVEPSAFVDMAGNAELRSALHHHLTDNLTSSRAVGMTHWQASAGLGGTLPGPQTEFFFAPSYAQQRLADWGNDGFQQRLAQAWTGFIAQAGDWFTVAHDTGADTVRARYLTMLGGDLDPAKGQILSMRDPG